MKKLILLLSILLQLGCSGNDDAKSKSYPECIKTITEGILKTPVQNPKVTIKKFNYNNVIVYSVNIIKPDASNLEVFDEKCNLICSQGITIEGIPFDTCIDWDKAVFIETVWTDPR